MYPAQVYANLDRRRRKRNREVAMTHPFKGGVMTVRLRFTLGFKVRLAVGLYLMRLAVRVLGGRTEIEKEGATERERDE